MIMDRVEKICLLGLSTLALILTVLLVSKCSDLMETIAPGFVEFDQVVPRLQCVWVSVTEFKVPALQSGRSRTYYRLIPASIPTTCWR